MGVRYPVCVDVSAKIEAWDKPSVIAVANDHSKALLVPAEIKVRALAMHKGAEPAQFALLAALAYLALQPELERISKITLDRDYSGEVAKRVIVRRLIELIRRERPAFRASAIRIDNVAGSAADLLARQVYKGARVPDEVVSWGALAAVLGQ